jgi:voltage-gated potassium channel
MSTPPAPRPHHPRPHRIAAAMVTRKPLTVRRAARLIASVTITMTLIGGVAIHFADRRAFPDVGAGLWWSVQTVTTVGYGDLVPTTALGRVVASIVMLGGIAFLTVVTATITSAFIESTRRRLQRVELSTLDGKLDTISSRLDAIESELRRSRGG